MLTFKITAMGTIKCRCADSAAAAVVGDDDNDDGNINQENQVNTQLFSQCLLGYRSNNNKRIVVVVDDDDVDVFLVAAVVVVDFEWVWTG